MTTSQGGVLLGGPPRHRSVPVAPTSAGQETVELAASAGLILDDWQQDVLHGSLGDRVDGKWAASQVGLIVPRQDGKGSILEARELGGLFLFGERMIIHSAHEFKTAQEAFRRVLLLVESTPDLDRLVMRVRTSHGEEGIELLTGQRLRFVARSTGSGRGFSGDCVILDEAYRLLAVAVSALVPTMAAMPNPQTWFTSSAPLPIVESDVLRGVCKRGRAGTSRRLAYFEFCAEVPVEVEKEMADPQSPRVHFLNWVADPEVWAEANPAYGIRIGPEFCADELELLGPEDYARERLGYWRATTSSTTG